MMDTMKFLFWASLVVVLYAYVGYPILVDLASRMRRRADAQASGGDELPSLTVIIPAHNEESWIGRKIENTLALDYPRDLMQILVASDGSTDKTVEIARQISAQGVEVVDLPDHAGKMATINRVMAQARGEIVILTDATALLERDALGRVIPHFADGGVGCVSGDRLCITSDSSASEGEGLYWRYESWIRRSESRYHSCLGAYGQLYAVRRFLFPFIPGTSDDFYVPMNILLSTGARTVFEPRARVRIPAAATLKREFWRKVRTHAALLWELPRLSQGLIPWKSPIWWEFWSHHVLRLFVPWAMVIALCSSVALWSAGPVYRLTLACQILLYSAAVAGLLLLQQGRRWKPTYACFYFLFANIAVGWGWVHWLMRERVDLWQKTERNPPSFAATSRADHGGNS
jgi:glycosyltransferase involved in cell wall biosynthesis